MHIYIYIYILTYSMEQSPSWEANWLVKKFPAFLVPESSSPYSQVPATCPYPEPTPSSPHKPLPLPEVYIYIYISQIDPSFCVTTFSVSLTSLTVLPPQSRDCSCYVSWPILAPPPLWWQKHTDLRAYICAHLPGLWHQPRLANITYAWSWRHCGITPAIQFWHIQTLSMFPSAIAIGHFRFFSPPAWPLVSTSRAGQTATKKESNCKADPHNTAYDSSRWQFAVLHSRNKTKAKQDLKNLMLHLKCLGLYFRNTRYKAVSPNTVCDACN